MKKKSPTIKSRNSNLELLRIVAMCFICIHHVLIFGLGACNYPFWTVPHIDGGNELIENSLQSVCIIGVNLFVLITGWFGVKSVKDSILRIISLLIIVCCVIFIFRTDYTIEGFHFAITFDHWWYVPHFVVLILCSPIIERSIKSINFKEYSLFILYLTIINLLFGFRWEYLNFNGYNYVHFIYLYYLARYIRIFADTKYISYIYKYSHFIFITSTICILGLHTIQVYRYGFYDISWRYNNPLVILSSISFFLCFTKIKKQSNIINYFSRGTFAVYLLSTKEFSDFAIGDNGVRIYNDFSYIGMVAYCISFILLLYIPCSLIGNLLLHFPIKIKQH